MATRMGIKIDDGIPLPPKATGWGSSAFPFAEMKQGQSFAIPIAKGDTKAKLRNRLQAASVRAGVCVAVRDEGDGVRVWHVGRRVDVPKKPATE